MLELLIPYNVNIMIFSRQFEELCEEKESKKIHEMLDFEIFLLKSSEEAINCKFIWENQ
jgi:hypothetical protein